MGYASDEKHEITKQKSLLKFSYDKKYIHHKSLHKKRTNEFPAPAKKNMFSISKHLKSKFALNVDHEFQSGNRIPASNLEKGLIIDSVTSAHVTHFKKDCTGTTKIQRTIFLPDDSSVQYRLVGIINIPIYKKKKTTGTLR